MKHTNTKRLLSLLLALLMVVSLLPTATFADTEESSSAGTSGDSTVVAKIGDTGYTDLHEALEAGKAAGTVVTLQSDVNLTGEWTPVADFNGTFDGANHTITGLTVSGADNLGLFASIGTSATVKDLTISGATINGTGSNVGTLAGSVSGSTVTNVTVTGATVTSTGGQYTGGMFGTGYPAAEQNCKVTNSTITGYDQVGGLIGYLWVGHIENCTLENNTVKATSERAGGIAGKIQIAAGNLGDSTMWINGNTVTGGSVTAPDYAGGVAGQIMGDVNYYSIKDNKIDTTLSASATNPIGNLRNGQNADFTGALAANITGNSWTKATYSENSFTYTNVDSTVTTAQTITNATPSTDFYADAEGVYHITNLAGLKEFRDQANAGKLNGTNSGRSGHTKVVLDADIDLNNEEWTPIEMSCVDFDGQNHTIKNLKVTTEDKNVGFFGEASISYVENLTIDTATVTGINHVAAIAGDGLCGHFINCHVKNAVITASVKDSDDGDKAGAICGYLSGESDAEVTNCTVDNCTIRGYRDIGGAVGYANGTAQVTGNTITNTTVINDQENNYKNYASDAAFDANKVVGETTSTATVSDNTAGTDVVVVIANKKVVVKDEETGDNKTATVTEQEQSAEVVNAPTDATEATKNYVDELKNNTTTVTGVELTDIPTVDNDTKTGMQAVVDAAKEAVKTDSAKTAAVESATEIKIDIQVEVQPKEVVKDETETSSITISLDPKATVTAVTTDGEQKKETVIAEDIEVTNDMIDQTQKISVSFYTGFKPAQIVHTDDDGKVIEVFTGDQITYNEETKIATVQISHFSDLTATVGEKVAYIGTNGYETLAAALLAAESGDTIEVVEGTLDADAIGTIDNSTVRSKSLTIKPVDGAKVTFTSTLDIGYEDSSTSNATMNISGFAFENASLYVCNYVQASVTNCTFNGSYDSGEYNAALVIKNTCCTNHKTSEEYPTDQATVSGCTFNNTVSQAICMFNTGNATVTNNVITNAGHNGIGFQTNYSNKGIVTISGNTITEWNASNTSDGGRAIRLALGTLAEGSIVTVNNNTFRKTTLNLDAPDFMKVTGAGSATVNLSENDWNNEILSTVKGNSAYYTCDATSTTLNSVISTKTVYVAQIGDTKYETLADAIAAVPTDGTETTITMIADETIPQGSNGYGVSFPAGTNVVLELNGHTISGSDSSNGGYGMLSCDGTSLTIQDSSNDKTGTVIYTSTTTSTWHNTNTINVNNGKLTIKGGIFKCVDTVAGASYVVNLSNNTHQVEVQIDGGTFLNPNGDAVIRMHTQTRTDTLKLTINNGTFTGGIYDSVVWVDVQGTKNTENTKAPAILEINGGTFKASEGCPCIDVGNNGYAKNLDIDINGGSFNSDTSIINYRDLLDEDIKKMVTINGGYFSNKVAKHIVYSGSTVTSQNDIGLDYTVVEGKTVIETPDGDEKTAGYIYTIADAPVAQIGDIVYVTLADAIAAVPTDGTETTITMIADENIQGSNGVKIASSQNIILELNGKTISAECNSGANSAVITNEGTLVIQDNTDSSKTGSGTGRIVSGADPVWIYEGSDDYTGSYASNAITNTGTLTLESGSIRNVSQTGSATYAIDNYYAGKVTINGGSVVTDRSSAIRQCNGSSGNEVTINGGVINGSFYGVQVHCISNAKLTINGGTISGGYIGVSETSNSDDTNTVKITNGTINGGSYSAIDFSRATFNISGGTVNGKLYSSAETEISGGTFNSSIVSYLGYYTKTAKTFKITNGTFNGDVNLYDYYGNGENVSITGGKFSGPYECVYAVYSYNSTWDYIPCISGGIFSREQFEYDENEDGEPETHKSSWVYEIVDGKTDVDNTDDITKEVYPYTVADIVAQIGDIVYATLQDAVNAATEGCTVKVLENIELTARVDAGVNAAYTIDLNGKTVSSTATCGNGSAFNIKAGTVTIQNGTIDGTAVTQTAEQASSASNECDAITVRSGATVNLVSDLTVKVDSITGSCVYAFNGGKVNISGGSYENAATEDYPYKTDFKALVVNQANVTTASLFNITGGTFKGQNPADGDDSWTAGTALSFIADGYASAETDEGVYTVGEAVASITTDAGTTYYATLDDAIAAVGDTAATITLLANVDENVTIPSGKTVTLDLAGFTVNGKTTSNTAAITNNGTLTVQDSSTGKTGTICREDTGSSAYYVVDNQGTLTFEGGSVTNGSGSTTAHAGASLIRNGEGSSYATLNIKGGTFTQNYFNVIKDGGNSEVNISGGTISCGQKYAILSYGKVNITGGTITGPLSFVGYKDNDGEVSGQGTISGGTINGAITIRQYTGYHATTNPSLTITGGQFGSNTTFTVGEGKSDTAVTANNEYGTLSISGGVYAKTPNNAYVATGKTVITNTDSDTKAQYPFAIGTKTADIVIKEQDETAGTSEVTVDVDTTVDYSVHVEESKVKIPEEVQEAITSNTVVTGVELEPEEKVTSGTETVNGVQAVVNAAKAKAEEENNTSFTNAVAASTTTNTTVTVKVDVQVTPVGYSDTESKNTIEFDLTPIATVTIANTGSTAVTQQVAVTNEMIDTEQDITVTLYTGFKPGKLVHRGDDGSIIDTYYPVDTEGAENTFTYDETTGVATAIVHHFSSMEAYEEVDAIVTVAKIGTAEYESLADAIAAVTDGGTIVLLADNSEEITVSEAKTFTIDPVTYTFTDNISAGTGLTKSVVNNVFTFSEVTYTVGVQSRINGTDNSIANVSGGGDISGVTGTTISAPNQAGYTFLGWYTGYSSGSIGTLVTTDHIYTYVPTEDVTLTAVYEASTGATFSLTVDGSKFKITGNKATQKGYQTYTFNASDSITVEYTDTSYKFLYWANGNDKVVCTSAKYTFTLGSNVNLHAVYTDESVAGSEALVVFLSAYEQIMSACTYTTEDTIAFPTTPSKMGYTFEEWIIDGTQNDEGGPTEATEGDIKAAMATSSIVKIVPIYVSDGTKYSISITYRVGDDKTKDVTKPTIQNITSGDACTVTADDTLDSSNFSYWTDSNGNILTYDKSYTVVSTENVSLIAVYGDEKTPTAISAITSVTKSMNGDYYKLTFTESYYIPAGCTLVRTGFVRTRDEGTATEANMVIDGANTKTFQSKLTDSSGIYTVNLSVTSAELVTYMRGYVQYMDSEGKLQTVYSKIIGASYSSISN